MSSTPNELKQIFGEAISKPTPAEREAYLRDACSHDPNLRPQIDSLLAAHEECRDFLQQNVVTSPAIGEGPGNTIGRYKLLQQIGEGGFGVVFMAEQQEPVRRMVALKIIKAGMDTREVIARFEAERQALALMDHPNIARVLDAGATESGRPYFVMDLVKGVPITDFCEQHRLSTEARLRLFMQVCSAVQHAHQKGIIHRDLKPTNVLVTLHDGEPIPKVIDFGISKAIGQRLTDKTLFTRFEQLMGTPSYMSPEQAEWSGLDIDTRSDIFSLGVLLYELLTGTTPLEKETVSRAALDEIRRLIREQEPERPSQRLSRVTRNLHHNLTPALPSSLPSFPSVKKSEIRNPRSEIDPDLDWIILKSLEKDRTRRYETVNALTRDVEHHLQGEPVGACPPSAVYRARKFIYRHRVGVSIATVVSASLLFGLVLALLGFTQARRERNRAEKQAAVAKAVSDFLQNDFMKQADRWRNPDRDIKLRTVLDRASTKVVERFPDQPIVQATLHQTLGETYLELGELEAAEQHLAPAIKLRNQALGPENPDTLQSLAVFGRLHALRGMYSEAERELEHVTASYQRLFGTDDSRTLRTTRALGENYLAWDRTDKADLIFRELLPGATQVFGADHPETLFVRADLSRVYLDSRRYFDAAAAQEELLTQCRRLLGPENPLTLQLITLLGSSTRFTGDLSKSAELLKESVDLKRRINGDRHPETVEAYKELAVAYSLLGRWSECLTLCAHISKTKQPGEFRLAGGAIALMLGDNDAYHTFVQEDLAEFSETNDFTEARRLAELSLLAPIPGKDLEAVLRAASFVRTNEPFTWDKIALAMAEYRQGHLAAATKWLEQAAYCASSAARSQAAYLRAMILQKQNDPAGAQRFLADAGAAMNEAFEGNGFAGDWHEYPRVCATRVEAEQLIYGRALSSPLDARSLKAKSAEWQAINERITQGDKLAGQRQWKEARNEYLAAIGDPHFRWAVVDKSFVIVTAISKVASVLALAGDHEGHQQICEAELKRESSCPVSFRAWRIAKIYLASSHSSLTHEARQAVERLMAVDHPAGGMLEEEANLVRALAAYRFDQLEKALTYSEQAAPSLRLSIRGAAQIIRCAALFKLDREREGKVQLAAAEVTLGKHLATLTGDNWYDLAFCQLLLDEARSLFNAGK
jgi:serine/threonine protein kinase